MTELRDVDHTNPYTGKSFGRTQVYDRGKTVVADGGEADATAVETDDEGEASEVTAADATDADRDNLEDVAHTPPRDEVGAQGAYERGDRDAEDERGTADDE